VSDKLPQATERTRFGELTVTWGVNDWVMIDLHGRSGQRQVKSWHELADLLVDVGFPRNEAAAEARSLWHARPTDAAAETSRPGEEMWKATGLPAWAVALVLLAVIAIYVLYRVAHLRG